MVAERLHLELHDSACSAEIGLSDLDLKLEAPTAGGVLRLAGLRKPAEAGDTTLFGVLDMICLQYHRPAAVRACA